MFRKSLDIKHVFMSLLLVSLFISACGGGGSVSTGSIPPWVDPNPQPYRIYFSVNNSLVPTNQSIVGLVRIAGDGISISAKEVVVSGPAGTSFSVDGINFTNGRVSVMTNSEGHARVWMKSSVEGFVVYTAEIAGSAGIRTTKTVKVKNNVNRLDSLDPITITVDVDNNGNKQYNETDDFILCNNSEKTFISLKVKISYNNKPIKNTEIVVRPSIDNVISFPNDSHRVGNGYKLYTNEQGEADLYANVSCSLARADRSINLLFESDGIALSDYNNAIFRANYIQTLFIANVVITSMTLRIMGEIDGDVNVKSNTTIPIMVEIRTQPPDVPVSDIGVKLIATCGTLSETEITVDETFKKMIDYTTPTVAMLTRCTITSYSNGKTASRTINVYPEMAMSEDTIEITTSTSDQTVETMIQGGVGTVVAYSDNSNVVVLGVSDVDTGSLLKRLTLRVLANFVGTAKIYITDDSGTVRIITVKVLPLP